MFLLLEFFLLLLESLPLLWSQPAVVVNIEVVALVIDDLGSLGGVGLVVQQSVFALHGCLVLTSGVATELLVEILRLLALPVQNLLLLVGDDQVATEQTRPGALLRTQTLARSFPRKSSVYLNTDNLATSEAVVDQSMF